MFSPDMHFPALLVTFAKMFQALDCFQRHFFREFGQSLHNSIIRICFFRECNRFQKPLHCPWIIELP